jgi:hypothetical protein
MHEKSSDLSYVKFTIYNGMAGAPAIAKRTAEGGCPYIKKLFIII